MTESGCGAIHCSLKPVYRSCGTLQYDSRLENKVKDLTRQLNEIKDANQNLQNKCTELEQKLEKESRAARRLTLVHENTIVQVAAGTDIDQIVKEENTRLKEDNNRLKIENLEQKTEIDALLLRLSKIAGDKMVDGNASITNLGDINRPQKLSERFISLYDNCWTDAFEQIEKDMSEKDVCQQLLLIFQSCWKFCTAYAQEQLEDLIVTLLLPFRKNHDHDVYEDDSKTKGVKNEKNETNVKKDEHMATRNDTGQVADENNVSKDKQNVTEEEQRVPKDDRKKQIIQDIPNVQINLIKDTRRCFAQQFIPTLFKLYGRHVPENEIPIAAKSVRQYVESCLELCWHSAISNPPLQFSFTVDNIDNFKGYTQNGKEVDYVVWPAMYLYECGPLLNKGVVQFKKLESQMQ